MHLCGKPKMWSTCFAHSRSALPALASDAQSSPPTAVLATRVGVNEPMCVRCCAASTARQTLQFQVCGNERRETTAKAQRVAGQVSCCSSPIDRPTPRHAVWYMLCCTISSLTPLLRLPRVQGDTAPSAGARRAVSTTVHESQPGQIQTRVEGRQAQGRERRNCRTEFFPCRFTTGNGLSQGCVSTWQRPKIYTRCLRTLRRGVCCCHGRAHTLTGPHVVRVCARVRVCGSSARRRIGLA